MMNTTVDQIHATIPRLEEARQRVLTTRSTDAIIEALSGAAQSWLVPGNPWQVRALEAAPAPGGFSTEMLREVTTLTFGAITPDALSDLIERELGNRRALDEFCQHGRRRARATGPRLIAHFLAGNIPAPGILSICCGLLARSANLVRLAGRDPVFPALFVESLRTVDPDLADCVATLHWPRAEVPVTRAALAGADAVLACGDDNTIATVRSLAPPAARFLGYGHKLSVAVVAREALVADDLPALAEAAAFDACIYDQQGCLSPHLFFVEDGGAVSPRQFGEALARAMAAFQARVPRGALALGEAARVNALRTGYEFRARTDRRVTVWAGADPADWAVIYEEDPTFAPSCLNRVVFVKPIAGFQGVLAAIQGAAPFVSCVGLAPLNERSLPFAAELARLGIHRVCPIGQMQRPPLSGYHDGRPNLADLVHWTDLG